MFARAAIVGRVARERSEARRNFLHQKRELKKKAPQATLRQRCFIPVLRGPCMTVAAGCFLIIIGAIMCNFAFHARDFSIITIPYANSNRTAVTETLNQTKYQGLKSLTFIGPSLMGLGIFIIIIACVLLLDKRDKILKQYLDSIMRPQQEISMELSYRAVTTSDVGESSNQLPRKESSTYSEVTETKSVSSTSKHSSRKSSLQCIQNFVLQGISGIPEGQDIELVTLDERSESPTACDNSPEIDSASEPDSPLLIPPNPIPENPEKGPSTNESFK